MLKTARMILYYFVKLVYKTHSKRDNDEIMMAVQHTRVDNSDDHRIKNVQTLNDRSMTTIVSKNLIILSRNRTQPLVIQHITYSPAWPWNMIIFNRQSEGSRNQRIPLIPCGSWAFHLTLRNLWASYATIHKKSEFQEKY